MKLMIDENLKIITRKIVEGKLQKFTPAYKRSFKVQYHVICHSTNISSFHMDMKALSVRHLKCA